MSPASNLTLAERVAEALVRHGVEALFGQSIPVPVILAACDRGIRQVGYRAENAGGAMADGYARIRRRIGVVCAQNGPAATLLVPPLAEALKASTPVLALVQDVARTGMDRNAFQELDHLKLFDGVVKWVRRVEDPDRIDAMVEMAIVAATSGRPGPAVLLLPHDLLGAPAAMAREGEALGHCPLDRTVPEPAALDRARELLLGAERPIVIAGGGVLMSDAVAELAELRERLALPVATTVMGKGAVDETHPLSLGVLSYFLGKGAASRHHKALLDEADLVFLIGTRTNQNGTDSWTLYPPSARYIHLDVDGLEIGRNVQSVRLVGDAKASLPALLERVEPGDRKGRRAGLEARIAQDRQKAAQEMAAMATSGTSPIRPERLMAELDRLVTPDTICVADASYASIWLTNNLVCRRAGQRFITPRGIAGLGWGLPLALGARVAEPGVPIVCLVGDGGFAHCWAELETARRMRLPLLVVVLNNGVLGYQQDAERAIYGRNSDACTFTAVDHAAIARACGVEGRRIEDPAELSSALKAGLEAREPMLLDVVTDPKARPPITAFEGKLDYR